MSPNQQPSSTLAGAQEHFRLLVGGLPDYAILLLDPRGYVASWNAGAERIHQYREDEVLGEHFSL